MEEKSINKKFKESGTSLSFKEWLTRENEKKQSANSNFLSFDNVVDSTQIQNEINQGIKQDLNMYEDTPPVISTQINPNNVLGIDKSVLIFSGILILGSLTYYFIKRAKANK